MRRFQITAERRVISADGNWEGTQQVPTFIIEDCTFTDATSRAATILGENLGEDVTFITEEV